MQVWFVVSEESLWGRVYSFCRIRRVCTICCQFQIHGWRHRLSAQYLASHLWGQTSLPKYRVPLLSNFKTLLIQLVVNYWCNGECLSYPFLVDFTCDLGRALNPVWISMIVGSRGGVCKVAVAICSWNAGNVTDQLFSVDVEPGFIHKFSLSMWNDNFVFPNPSFLV